MSVRYITWAFDQRVGDHTAKAVLVKLADNANDQGVAWPSIDTISRDTEIPVRTVKRKLAFLLDAGFIEVQAERREGRFGGNVYRLLPGATVAHGGPEHRGPREVAPGANAGAHARAVPSLREPSGTVTPPSPPGEVVVRGPAAVARRKTTGAELALAADVLAAWNRSTGQHLTADDWLAMVIRRHREHPELGLPEFEHLIAATLESPWWDGVPTPNLIFGSGAQLERCIAAATAPRRVKPKPKRFGRGVTTTELLEMAAEHRRNGR